MSTEYDHYSRLIEQMPIESRANHLLAIRNALEHSNEPLLCNIIWTNGEHALYAWYPSAEEDVCRRALDILCVTLSNASELDNHRTLVDCFLGLLHNNSKMSTAKEAARTLLTECFGAYQLGVVKRVIRPADQRERQYGELDFYLLPQKSICYTWLGR